MVTDPKEYQKSRQPWSKWKHAILEKYLKAMAAILHDIFFVDGFAGPGIYVEDGSKGSPILAAKHAKNLSHFRKPRSLRCINVEHDADVFANLESSTAKYSQWVENLHGEFGVHVAHIVSRIGNHPTLFFLDPIGVKGLEWSKLQPIVRRQSKTEILIRFHADAALRLAGSDVRHHPRLNAIMGQESSSYWQKYIAECSNSGQARRKAITRAYENKLRECFAYVAKIPIKDAKQRFKYFLLFATRSLKGAQVMNDVTYSVNGLRDRTLDFERRANEESYQLNMFQAFPEIEVQSELEALKCLVVKSMRTEERIRRNELRAKVALKGDNFGRFSGPQFTAVLSGKSRKIAVSKEFESLKARIKIHNGLPLGNDRVEISLAE